LLLQKHQKHRCQEIQKYRNVVEVKGAQHPWTMPFIVG
jgi:hypothetical protein